MNTNRFIFMTIFLTLLLVTCLAAQPIGQISGKVTDLQNRPLPDVNVTVVSTDMGTITDENGHFVLTGLQPGAYQLHFSHIAYEITTLKDIEIATGDGVDVGVIVLKPRVLAIGEFVTTATRTQKPCADQPVLHPSPPHRVTVSPCHHHYHQRRQQHRVRQGAQRTARHRPALPGQQQQPRRACGNTQINRRQVIPVKRRRGGVGDTG